MKLWEYFGVGLAIAGFSMLTIGYLFTGFTVGLLSCFVLIPFFGYVRLYGMMGLQIFFICANILGMYNNWGTM